MEDRMMDELRDIIFAASEMKQLIESGVYDEESLKESWDKIGEALSIIQEACCDIEK